MIFLTLGVPFPLTNQLLVVYSKNPHFSSIYVPLYLCICYQYSCVDFYYLVVYIHTRLIYFGVQLAPSLSSGSHFKLYLILMRYTYH